MSVDTVDISVESEWNEPPKITFRQKASLQIARWMLIIFTIVNGLCFVLAFMLLKREESTFDGGIELVKFLLSTILPVVTLAVGYYLGERNQEI